MKSLAGMTVLAILFGVLSCLDDPVRVRDHPFFHAMAKSDKAFTATLVKASETPELFSRDYFLSDPSNHNGYIPFLVALVRWTGRVAGDYLLPFYWLGAVVTFIQLWGFFLLGRVLFGHASIAVLLAVGSLGTSMSLVDWGPAGLSGRGLFSALLPYLLACSWRWRGTRWTWPLILAGCGLLIFVHPVSAPVWAPAFLLACFSQGWGEWWQKVRWALVAALIFIVFGAGFAMRHIGGESRSEALSPASTRQYMAARSLIAPEYALSVSQAARGTFLGDRRHTLSEMLNIGRLWMLKNTFRKGLVPLLLLGIIAFLIGLGNRGTHEMSLWASLLAVGVLLGSVIIPGAIEWLERQVGAIPFIFELVRGIGYLVPLILILGFIALAAVATRLKFKLNHRLLGQSLVFALNAAFLTAWLIAFPPRMLGHWKNPVSEEKLRQGQYLKEILTYVREETAPGEMLIGYQGTRYIGWQMDDLAMFIRLYGERPVAFCYKDGSFLMVQNPSAFLSWAEKYLSIRKTLSRPWGDKNDILAFCSLAYSWGARFWLADRELLDAKLLESLQRTCVRYRNAGYVLIDLKAFMGCINASNSVAFLPASQP